MSLVFIKELRFEYPEPGYLLTVHSQVEAKSKTMGCWVRQRPLLSTYRKISGCLSLLRLEKLFLSRRKTVIGHEPPT